VDSVLSIDVILEICFTVGGERGGKRPRRPPCVGEVHTIYPLSEMRVAFFDTIGGVFFEAWGWLIRGIVFGTGCGALPSQLTEPFGSV
jgi:hypothetical protein